jgi:predicted nucleic acid-binding protein
LNVFFDSSALAKRYINESGSDRVEQILAKASSLGVSVLCLPEVVSALCRRRRERKLSAQQYSTAKKELFADIADATVVYVTDLVVAGAVDLLENWPLRSWDSLQVASAAEWAADLFVSADRQQCVAAKGRGLRVEELPGN